MADGMPEVPGHRLLESLRAAFAKRDWDRTLALYEDTPQIRSYPQEVLVEAVCLAARSLAALDERSRARGLIRTVDDRDYADARLYDLMAWAYLDAKNFGDAARCCEHAAALTASLEEGEDEVPASPPMVMAAEKELRP